MRYGTPIGNANVPLPALYASYVRPVQTSGVREGFLAISLIRAKFADGST